MRLFILFALCAILPFVFAPSPNQADPDRGTAPPPAVPVIFNDSLLSVAMPIANAYVGSLNSTLWSEELSSWLSKTAYSGVVDTFQGVDIEQWESEKFCFRTDTVQNGCTVTYSFYDDGNFVQPRGILQQVEILDRRTKPSEKMTAVVWGIISDSLTRSFGASQAVPKDAMLHPFDLGPVDNERENVFWQDSVKRIILAAYYTWDAGGRSDCIVLFSRALALDSLLRRKGELETRQAGMVVGNAMRAEICDSLRAINSPLVRLSTPAQSSDRRLSELIDCGEFVSAARRRGDTAHLPLYRMALYAFGSTYTPGSPEGPGPFKDVDTLRHYNIVFEGSSIGGPAWEYSDAPLVTLYNESPASHWGQLAFLILQNSGWCLDNMCNGNNGPIVIAKGEEFLKQFPGSQFIPQVLLTIAKGHETNWNVSTCDPKESEYLYDGDRRDDEASRLKAIELYERILKEYPGSPEAGVAEARLPRLKLMINTDKRDYMFIYD